MATQSIFEVTGEFTAYFEDPALYELVKQPDWVHVQKFGSEFEEEVDINAASDSAWQWRHRKIVATGQTAPDWSAGRAPR